MNSFWLPLTNFHALIFGTFAYVLAMMASLILAEQQIIPCNCLLDLFVMELSLPVDASAELQQCNGARGLRLRLRLCLGYGLAPFWLHFNAF